MVMRVAASIRLVGVAALAVLNANFRTWLVTVRVMMSRVDGADKGEHEG
jgi:hypothetical protein